MKQLGLTICCIAVVALRSLVSGETDREVQAHKLVLDLAGAFSNEGFKMRDGHWTGALKQKENALVAVNLYAGNQYWFSVGAVEPAKKIELAVYDEAGQRVTTETYNDGDKAAAGFTPASSGQYYVSIGLVEGNETTYCLVYSYK
jgi:hypothetical protein